MALNDRNIIFLTGAPRPSAVSWEENALSEALLPCFTNGQHGSVRPTPEMLVPSWRSLPLEKAHWPTGLTQADRQDCTVPGKNTETDASFVTTTDLSMLSTENDHRKSQLRASSSDAEDALSGYYEHSFAVHDVPSSQILGPASAASSLLGNSFESARESDSIPPTTVAQSRLCSAHLSHLMDIPNAIYLRSIMPQTMTVDLVLGIISISQPRTLVTRKGSRTVELVEMLVGDGTRAGFGITVWLPSHPAKKSNVDRSAEDDLRSRTLRLRPQDIILAKNVALSSFRGKVHGQSLRRGMTTLDLLYRNMVDRDDERGAYRSRELDQASSPNLCKTKQVKDWVMQFVGTNRVISRVKVLKCNDLSSLPLDTQ
ncbi:MAG: hypothetical protein Q9164_006909 [Protoblastenia rupestris]